MIRQRIVSIFMVGLLCVMMLVGCSRPGTSSSGSDNDDSAADTAAAEEDQSYTFQVGHVVTTDHSYHLGLQRFAELAAEKSGNRINIEIFPSSQLGNERDLVEGLTMGTVDMALCNSGNLATFIDSYQVFDLPYLFRDNEHAHKVLDSEIGQNALASLSEIGIEGFANWENGFFCTWNSERALNDPADIAGLKIRANDNMIHIDTYKELEASAITMGWSEVYTAIQNGTVDGVSVSIPSMYTAKIQEVAPYISTSNEFYVTVILMMNKDLYDGLPEDIQTALKEAAKEATQYQRELNGQMTDDFIQSLKDEGYEVTHPDMTEWKEACWQPIYDKYADQLGADIIDSIQNDY